MTGKCDVYVVSMATRAIEYNLKTSLLLMGMGKKGKREGVWREKAIDLFPFTLFSASPSIPPHTPFCASH